MPNEILVLNAGSSTLKASLFEAITPGTQLRLAKCLVDGIGGKHPRLTISTGDKKRSTDLEATALTDHPSAIRIAVEALTESVRAISPIGIGHRIVHGGSRYSKPALLVPNVESYLQSLVPLAPLHQPANLLGVSAARAAFPEVPQIACFDTAFHAGGAFPRDAYALPRVFHSNGIRRYGFHGLSYEHIAIAFRKLAPQAAGGRVIVAHLGNGASMCAMHDGRSVGTTMGFSTVEGLPMGTRSGQLDPGILLYLLNEKRMTTADLADLLYKQSGLLGLSGISSDMRDLLQSEEQAPKDAIAYFVEQARWHIGGLSATLGGLDALVFTAGIGENSARIRREICSGLEWLGLSIDGPSNERGGPLISSQGSRVSAWVVPTDEEQMIACHVADLLGC